MKFELTLKRTSLGYQDRGIPPDFVIKSIKVDKALIKLYPDVHICQLAYMTAARLRNKDYRDWSIVGLTDHTGNSIVVLAHRVGDFS